MEETWFRFEDIQYAPSLDEWDDVIGGTGRLTIQVQCLPVAKHTPKGVRLCNGKFILREGRKRWACPTVQEALESFIARKQRQKNIHLATVRRAESAIAMVANKTLAEALKSVDNRLSVERFLV